MARRMRRSEAPNPQAALIDLDLTALAQALPDILARGERESLSYVEFSLALLVAE